MNSRHINSCVQNLRRIASVIRLAWALSFFVTAGGLSVSASTAASQRQLKVPVIDMGWMLDALQFAADYVPVTGRIGVTFANETLTDSESMDASPPGPAIVPGAGRGGPSGRARMEPNTFYVFHASAEHFYAGKVVFDVPPCY